MCNSCTTEDLEGNLLEVDCDCTCMNPYGEFLFCGECDHYTGLRKGEY